MFTLSLLVMFLMTGQTYTLTAPTKYATKALCEAAGKPYENNQTYAAGVLKLPIEMKELLVVVSSCEKVKPKPKGEQSI